MSILICWPLPFWEQLFAFSIHEAVSLVSIGGISRQYFDLTSISAILAFYFWVRSWIAAAISHDFWLLFPWSSYPSRRIKDKLKESSFNMSFNFEAFFVNSKRTKSEETSMALLQKWMLKVSNLSQMLRKDKCKSDLRQLAEYSCFCYQTWKCSFLETGRYRSLLGTYRKQGHVLLSRRRNSAVPLLDKRDNQYRTSTRCYHPWPGLVATMLLSWWSCYQYRCEIGWHYDWHGAILSGRALLLVSPIASVRGYSYRCYRTS